MTSTKPAVVSRAGACAAALEQGVGGDGCAVYELGDGGRVGC